MRRLRGLAAMLAAALGAGVSVAGAQAPEAVAPANYAVVLDNPQVRVYRVYYGPHEKVAVHDHSDFATVYIYLNDSGPVRFRHEEASHFEVVRPPTHTGAFRVSPGRIERHDVENLSEKPSKYLRVELKNVPVRTLKEEFRGPPPPLPLTPGETVAYEAPQVRVERVICAAGQVCAVKAEAAGSVLAAVGAGTVLGAGTRMDAAAPVVWVPAGTALRVRAGDGPLDLLRVVLVKN